MIDFDKARKELDKAENEFKSKLEKRIKAEKEIICGWKVEGCTASIEKWECHIWKRSGKLILDIRGKVWCGENPQSNDYYSQGDPGRGWDTVGPPDVPLEVIEALKRNHKRYT